MNEASCVLVGQRRGPIWHARIRQRRVGGPASAEFEWGWVLAREERFGDVLGFYHTHPPGLALPSERDLRTMRAWVSCLGKPLLCVIESARVLAGTTFAGDEDAGQPLPVVERFPRSVIVAVEAAIAAMGTEVRHA